MPQRSARLVADALARTTIAAFLLAGVRISAVADVAEGGRRTTLWLIGDSTVQVEAQGQRGWGSELQQFFDARRLAVVNRARGGRSSRTYFREGPWEEVRRELKPGDFVMAQFGHNDGGPIAGEFAPGRAAAPAQRQMERLDRGLVAIPRADGGGTVTWRLRAGDPEGIRFNVRRVSGDGAAVKLNVAPLDGPTYLIDRYAAAGETHTYRVYPVVGTTELPSDGAFTVAAHAPVGYLSIPLQTPEGYHANDASVGDLTGDGRYEIVVKMQRVARDNSHSGVTDPTIFHAYTLEGERLWAINLGRNIRSGAHYTPFLVYDFDGDGRAELVCKTADGTADGLGNVIGDPDADHRNESGFILKGPEFLTVFDGRTGKALDTVDYIPLRGIETHSPTPERLHALWGDDWGNRADRFLAGVAYLDGRRPSIVMCRGYYTRSVLVAWNWRDGRLARVWTFDSDDGTPGNRDYSGQGNHSLSVADVDGDGRDEIIYGAMVVDDNGQGLHSTRLFHGDALHVGDLDPIRPGLEIFMPHESVVSNGGIGTSFRDARTGRLLWTTSATDDVGRGMAADIDPRHLGAELWGPNSANLYNARGEVIGRRPGSVNFGIWWTGDRRRALLDHRGAERQWHGVVYRWNEETQEQEIIWEDRATRSNNHTKGNPSLSADILGDWREEMIWRTAANDELRIYVTPHPTAHRLVTLMHDSQYRLAVAWQNVGYNQPPHPSFHLGPDRDAPRRSSAAATVGTPR